MMTRGSLDNATLGSLFAEQPGGEPTIAIATLITSVSIAMTVLLLIFSLWRGRKSSRVRPLFDALRLVVQIAVATAIPLITGIITDPLLVGGAALVGLAAGAIQGQLLKVEVNGDRVFAKRTIAGFLVWGAGLLLMQSAGLANRTGLLEIGQAITWFSIGVGAGLLGGRHASVVRAIRVAAAGAGALVLFGGVAVATMAVDAPPAEAQGCPPGFEQGYFDEDTQSQVGTSDPTQCSKWVNGRQGTYSIWRSGCDLAGEWSSKTGQSTSNPVYGQNAGLGYALYDNMIVKIQTVPASNGLDLEPAAREYARWFGGNCAPAPAPTARPAPTQVPAPNPAPTAAPQAAAPGSAPAQPTAAPQAAAPGSAPAQPPAAPVQPAGPTATPQIIVEQLDPNAVPESREIEDEGGSLFPTPTPEPVEEQAEAAAAGSQDGEQDGDEQNPDAPDDEPDPAAPEADPDGTEPTDSNSQGADDPEESAAGLAQLGEDRNTGPDDQNVSQDEALAAAIAGLIAAALAGIITLSEAIAEAERLLGAAGRDPGIARPLIESIAPGPASNNDALPTGPGFDPNAESNNIFRNPETGKIDRDPDGRIWDPWRGGWLTEAEAVRAKQQFQERTRVLGPDGEPLLVNDGMYTDGEVGQVYSTNPLTGEDEWVDVDVARERVREANRLRDEANLPHPPPAPPDEIRPEQGGTPSGPVPGDTDPSGPDTTAPGAGETPGRQVLPDGTIIDESVGDHGLVTTTTTRPDGTVETSTRHVTGDEDITRHNPDGSTDQVHINRNGTSTTTTTNADGTTTEVYRAGGGTRTTTRAADGSTTETVIESNGDVTVTTTKTTWGAGTRTEVTRPDGTVATTVERPDGTVDYSETEPDGTTTVSKVNPDGTNTTVQDTDGDGHVDVELTVSPDGTSTKTTTNADGSKVVVRERPDGTTLTSTTSTEADGSKVTVREHPDGTTSRHTNRPDGTRETTFSVDEGTRTVTESPTGTVAQKTVAPDGTVTTQTIDLQGGNRTEVTRPDGTTLTTVERADGTIVYGETDPDGGSTVSEVKPDGTNTTVQDTDGDGDVDVEMTVSPDGTTTTTATNPDGSKVTTEARADGSTTTTTKSTNPDGTKVTVREHPDGTTSRHTTAPDGSTEETVDVDGGTRTTTTQPDNTRTTTTTANGQTTEELHLPDGSSAVATEDANGTRTTTLTDPDGSTSVMTEHPDGTETSVFNNADGIETTVRVGPDGTITTKEGEVTLTERPDGTTTHTRVTQTGMETTTTRPDGTVVERNQSASGRTTETETRPDKSSTRTVRLPDGTEIEHIQHADQSMTETTTAPNGTSTTRHTPRSDLGSMRATPERSQQELLEDMRSRFNKPAHLAGPREVNSDEYLAYLQEIERRFPNHQPADVLRALHAQEYEHDLGGANMPVPWDWPLFQDGSEGENFREIYNELNLGPHNQVRGDPVLHRTPRIVVGPNGERIDIAHTYAGPRSDMNRGDQSVAYQSAMRWAQTDGGDSWQVVLGSIPKTARERQLSIAHEYAPPHQREGNAVGVWLSNFYRSPENKDIPVSEAMRVYFSNVER